MRRPCRVQNFGRKGDTERCKYVSTVMLKTQRKRILRTLWWRCERLCPSMWADPSARCRFNSSQLVASLLRSNRSTYQSVCKSALLFRRSSGASHAREPKSRLRSDSVTECGTGIDSRSSACRPCVPSFGISVGTIWKNCISGWSGYDFATSSGVLGVAV